MKLFLLSLVIVPLIYFSWTNLTKSDILKVLNWLLVDI